MKRTYKKKTNSEKAKEELLNLEGSLTIWNIVKLKEDLLKALKKSENIKLNFEKAEEYDFSFLQLLFSVLQTAGSKGKEIILEKIKPEFAGLIKESGFINVNHPVFSIIKK